MLTNQAFFDILSDASRRRLLALLLDNGELCVCELTAALDLAQPKISRHLAVMREAEVLAMRREGTWVFYRLHPQLPLWALRIVETLRRDAAESDTPADAARLAAMSDRPVRCCP
jgi:ArsR family transcriptional regulator